jgi:hypothetical protein
MISRRRWWRRHPVVFFILGELISIALVAAGLAMIKAADKHVPPAQPLDVLGGVIFGVGFVEMTVWLVWGLVYLVLYLFGSARSATKERRKEPSGGQPDTGPAEPSGQDQAGPAGKEGRRGSGQSPDPSARRRSSFITARGWRRKPAATDGDPETGTPPADQQQNGQTSAPGTPTAGPAGSHVPGPTGPAAKRWLYADKPVEPTDPDALSFGAYADALALLMDTEDTNTPLTIAINGPWGSGKTSLAKMTEGRLTIGSDWDAPHVVCWFDAWANDDAPHLGAAFAASVARAVNDQRYWWVRLAMPLPSSMLSPEQRWGRRLWYGVLAVALAAVAVFWPTGRSLLTPFAHPGTAISALGHGTAAARLSWPALAVAVILLAQQLAPSVQGVARWIGAPGSEAARGSMADASGQLGHLIKQALRGNRRLIIFVDNLERCRPPRAVEVCEVVSQLIGHPDVVTVLIGDMDTIALSAEIKYAALETVSRKRGATGAYGREYLEKLIQIQLRLPPPLPENLRKMLVPAGDEPLAVPQYASRPNPGFAATASDSTTTVSSRRPGVSLAILSAVLTVIATIVTLGADIPTFLFGLAAVVLSALTERTVDRLGERRKKQDRTVIDDAVSKVLTAADKGLNPRKEEEIIEALREAVRNDEDAEISSTLRQQIVLGDPDERTRWIIRRRMRQYLVSNTELRTSLDNAVLRFLPLSPRGAKRMFNHAHLLLDTGIGRGVFYKQPPLRANQQPPLSADQLAVWIALTERWPSVAAAITADPSLMGKLEEEARGTAPGLDPEQPGIIAKKIGIDGLDSALLDLLESTEPLAPVVRTLVNFSPDLSPFTQRNARSARKRNSSGPAQPASAGHASIPTTPS